MHCIFQNVPKGPKGLKMLTLTYSQSERHCYYFFFGDAKNQIKYAKMVEITAILFQSFLLQLLIAEIRRIQFY